MAVKDLLGLTQTAKRQWAELSVFQDVSVKNWVLLRGIGHLGALGLATWLLLPAVSAWFFAAIAVALVANLAASAYMLLGRKSAQRRTGGVARNPTHQALLASCAGLTWGTGLAWLGFAAPPAEFLTLLAIVLALTIASAMNDAPPPLTTIGFTVVAMMGVFAGCCAQGMFGLLLVPVLVVVLVTSGTINRTRALLLARLASRHLAETSDTVSLLLREFQENEADWLWQVDPMRRLRGISPRFAYALGTTPERAEGQPLMQLISKEADYEHTLSEGLRELANRLKRRESFSSLAVQVTVGGQRRWWELSGTPLYDERQVYTGFRGVGSDITERRESDEKIAYLARYDMLTRLPNRLLLTETLSAALLSASQWRSRCAFLMLDLDRFKAVNDSLGHQTGDKLLAQVAGRLQSITGDASVSGRLGGDEFGIVIPNLEDNRGAEKLAELIIERLTEPYLVDGQTLYVGTSVGSAIGPRDGGTVEELMRNADLALYQAKDQGGGTYCEYEPSLHKSAEEKRNLEVALRSALDRNEMEVIFQPVVDANREHIVSFEALLRWESKDYGPVSPVKFIPLAEDTRQIIPIGEWVLRESCLEAMRWPAHIMVNVNVSPAQLLDTAFMPMLRHTLASTGLDPRRLEVEVTESVFMSDPTIARAALEQVMELGCSIALDDFGTGYSSLGYLRTMRFSTIKVDRLFVQGAAQGNRESLAIIRAVVAMTQSLEMTTTAEGVENADEALLIRSLGCTKIQGYHFGRPMAAKNARALLMEKQTAGYAAAQAS